ncbi:MAG: site-specific integrase [Candidatus Acidiferrales bacterium]
MVCFETQQVGIEPEPILERGLRYFAVLRALHVVVYIEKPNRGVKLHNAMLGFRVHLQTRITTDTIAALYLADRAGAAPKSHSWLTQVWDIHLRPFFGGYIASRITTEKLIEYRNERLETGASPTTVNKELTILRAIFHHGLEDYTPPKISRVPKFPERLKEPPPRQGFLTDEQYDALQEHARYPWLKALLAMAYTFGFRRAELVGRVQRNQRPMRVKQIDLKNRTIHLLTGETKNNEGRVVKMTNEVYDYLKVCVEEKGPDDAVFTWEDGSPVKDFRGSWTKMTKAAGVKILLHDFRRSAARNLIRSGVSQEVAKRITGHKTDSMFSRYNIVAENDLAEAAAKLEAWRNGRKTVTESSANS